MPDERHENYGRRVADRLHGRRDQDTIGVEASWLTRQMLVALVAIVMAVTGAAWALSNGQSSALAARIETLAQQQAADARQLGALTARSDATDVRLTGIDRKLDGIDGKLDRLLMDRRGLGEGR